MCLHPKGNFFIPLCLKGSTFKKQHRFYTYHTHNQYLGWHSNTLICVYSFHCKSEHTLILYKWNHTVRCSVQMALLGGEMLFIRAQRLWKNISMRSALQLKKPSWFFSHCLHHNYLIASSSPFSIYPFFAFLIISVQDPVVVPKEISTSNLVRNCILTQLILFIFNFRECERKRKVKKKEWTTEKGMPFCLCIVRWRDNMTTFVHY